MGTRGALGFYKNGINKITYNHWDSYPEGLGVNVAQFISKNTIEDMNMKFNAITMVKNEVKPTEEQVFKCMKLNLYNGGVRNQTIYDWYCLLYEAHGNLELYYKAGLMEDNANFLEDSLYCECGYIINLDNNTLEVYQGFQKEKTDTRYQPETPEAGYYGCKLIKTFNLNEDIETWMNNYGKEGEDNEV